MAKKQTTKRRRKRGAVPVLGAAGLSLSLASGASAALGPPTSMPAQGGAASHEIALAEEELSDVSLATFYVFDNESAAQSGARVRLAMGVGGCAGCGGCGCWTGTYYTGSVFGNGTPPPSYYVTKRPRRYAHAPWRKRVPKTP
jgi:hypothetical protein